MNMPNLHLDILPEEQRRLWDRLGETPTEFTLYGGTGLALQLGHRISIDFDFFAIGAFDPDALLKRIPYLNNVSGSDVLQLEENTLTCLVDGVKIS